jgi:hypothetical protein
MRAAHRHSPEARQRIADATRAAMASPAVRRKISERTKVGMGVLLPEIARLRDAWRGARPGARRAFICEVLAPMFNDVGPT